MRLLLLASAVAGCTSDSAVTTVAGQSAVAAALPAAEAVSTAPRPTTEAITVTTSAVMTTTGAAVAPISVKAGTIGTTAIEFATKAETAALMVADDPYFGELTSVDRQILLDVASVPSLADVRAHFGESAKDWSTEEMTALRATVARTDQLLTAAGIRLDLPPIVDLAKHDAKIFDGSPYTRGRAVFLPRSLGAGKTGAVTLAHELVHIADRHNPAKAAELYRLLGYDACSVSVASLGPDLRDRTITNPDTESFGTACITLPGKDGTPRRYIHVLAVTGPYDPTKPFWAILKPELVEVDAGGTTAMVVGGVTVVRELDDVFAKAVGGNGLSEPLHPEELLAGNVQAIVGGPSPDAPNTALLDQIRAALTPK